MEKVHVAKFRLWVLSSGCCAKKKSDYAMQRKLDFHWPMQLRKMYVWLYWIFHTPPMYPCLHEHTGLSQWTGLSLVRFPLIGICDHSTTCSSDIIYEHANPCFENRCQPSVTTQQFAFLISYERRKFNLSQVNALSPYRHNRIIFWLPDPTVISTKICSIFTRDCSENFVLRTPCTKKDFFTHKKIAFLISCM